MYNNTKILAIIPARGGSKGIKKKNIKLLYDKPLIAWTIEEAQKSNYIDHLIVSTDDYEIAEVAEKYGAKIPFIRPMALAADDTPGVLPVLHAIKEIPGYDYVILLQPTSPLRRVQDIDQALKQAIDNKNKIMVSVSLASKSPYWMYKINEEKQLVPLFSETHYLRRQDIPPTYETNGAIYISSIEWLNDNKTFIGPETIGYVMTQEDSHDIDSNIDFYICEKIMKSRERSE
ncbi:cytidylyltransferase domain-containing protein [Paenibacillus luteus]|uniref:acylneuraminate cytidylyltransferase family protein n=1 Tax=Paenibacillus luteus TaxID=2545753 RepID=UPI001142E327|nr:acylneuraminate cytidylyltransferase family protein [Paenibacillus luteus]